jgi:hypothetical protein
VIQSGGHHRRVRPRVGVLGEHAFDQVGQRPRDARAQRPHLGNRIVQVPIRHLNGVVTGVGRLAREHRDQDAAQGVHVGGGPRPASERLFRRHVGRRAHRGGGRREVGVGVQLGKGDAEVEELDVIAADHGVRRLDVAVHDADGVGGHQRGRGLAREGDGTTLRQGPLGAQNIGEGRAGQQLHDEVGDPVLGARVEDRDDPGMVEPRPSPRLRDETGGRR